MKLQATVTYHVGYQYKHKGPQKKMQKEKNLNK